MQGIAFRAADDTIWFTAEFQAGTFEVSGVEWMSSGGTVLGQTGGSAFSTTNGNVAIGADGRAWFSQCIVVSPGNGFGALSATSETGTENDYNLGGYVGNTVVSGRDGNLYLTEDSATSNASSVAQISTSGKILRTFPLPAGSVRQRVASGLAVGHTGDLWIVENGVNEIARLSPKSGAVTQYPIPTANADARNIALGSDCSLWFTEFGANQIGKITESGKITEYPIPTASAGADGIMGPGAQGCSAHNGGYVWFSEDTASAVAKLAF